MKITFKVVDSCWFFPNTGSDTFRSVLICRKEQESRKKIFLIMQKNLIRKGCFHMTLNARQSPMDSFQTIKTDDDQAKF